MTTLIFVRHGEAEGNVQKIFHGWYDSSLTENRAPASGLYGGISGGYADRYSLCQRFETDDGYRGLYRAEKQLDTILTAVCGRFSWPQWENVRWAKLPEQYRRFTKIG